MLTNYRKYTDKELSDFINGKTKADVLINGELVDTTYPRLAMYEFLNLSTQWDCKEFMGGYMTKDDYLRNYEQMKGIKIQGLLQVVIDNHIIDECSI